jgi:hypothetical protein
MGMAGEMGVMERQLLLPSHPIIGGLIEDLIGLDRGIQ